MWSLEFLTFSALFNDEIRDEIKIPILSSITSIRLSNFMNRASRSLPHMWSKAWGGPLIAPDHQQAVCTRGVTRDTWGRLMSNRSLETHGFDPSEYSNYRLISKWWFITKCPEKLPFIQLLYVPRLNRLLKDCIAWPLNIYEAKVLS